MAAPAIGNIWHLRRVAETASKPCDVCYRPAAIVLITPDQKDFFYICPGHLTDRGFCTVVDDGAEAAAKRRAEEMAREVELVKREYEEKLARKRKNDDKAGQSPKTRDAKKKDTMKKGDKTLGDNDVEFEKAAKQEKEEKINAIANKKAQLPGPADSPRVFSLHKVFYQKRLDRFKAIETARRNRERLSNPTLFPRAPTGGLG